MDERELVLRDRIMHMAIGFITAAALGWGLWNGASKRADVSFTRGYAAAVDSVRGGSDLRVERLPRPETGSQFWLGFVAAQHQLAAWTLANENWPGPAVADSLMREGYARYKDGYR